MPDLWDFTEAVQRLGSDLSLAPGSSGNASIKLDGKLWITASGTWLRNAGEAGHELVPIPLAEPFSRVGSGRPSIEVSMHLAIPQKLVLHLHAVNTIACSVRADGPEYVRPLLDGLRWAWIPYTPSGRPLGSRIVSLVSRQPQVFVLANHGLVVAADEIAEALSLVADVECRLRTEPRPLIPPVLALLHQRADDAAFAPARNRVIHTLATDPLSLHQFLAGSLYPCHWAYVSRHMAVAYGNETRRQTVERFDSLRGYAPAAILVPGEGVLVRRDADTEVVEQIAGLAEIARRIPDGAPIRYLSGPEVAGLALELGKAPPPPNLVCDPELSL
jgi:rhamnose utilization protein RhaD (predicted bifunctional aldolase and dehydrogenase)